MSHLIEKFKHNKIPKIKNYYFPKPVCAVVLNFCYANQHNICTSSLYRAIVNHNNLHPSVGIGIILFLISLEFVIACYGLIPACPMYTETSGNPLLRKDRRSTIAVRASINAQCIIPAVCDLAADAPAI